MRKRWVLALMMVMVLQTGVLMTDEIGFHWSTFFIDQTFTENQEAFFELAAVVECAVLGAWFGGIGGAFGGLACGLTGWA